MRASCSVRVPGQVDPPDRQRVPPQPVTRKALAEDTPARQQLLAADTAADTAMRRCGGSAPRPTPKSRRCSTEARGGLGVSGDSAGDRIWNEDLPTVHDSAVNGGACSFQFEELFLEYDDAAQLPAAPCSARGWTARTDDYCPPPASSARTQQLRPPWVVRHSRFPLPPFASIACLCEHCRLLVGPGDAAGGGDFRNGVAAACANHACDAHNLATRLRGAGYDAIAVCGRRGAAATCCYKAAAIAATAAANGIAPQGLDGTDAARSAHRQRHAFVVVKPPPPLAAGGRPSNSSQQPDGASTLLIVDPSLRIPFEVGEPCAHYQAVLDALPAVFVGDAPRLTRLIAWLAALLALHFERRGMPLPPWRTERALLARWQLCEGAGGC